EKESFKRPLIIKMSAMMNADASKDVKTTTYKACASSKSDRFSVASASCLARPEVRCPRYTKEISSCAKRALRLAISAESVEIRNRYFSSLKAEFISNKPSRKRLETCRPSGKSLVFSTK